MFYYGDNMENSKIVIGKRIRKFRQRQGLTQHDLAEKIGVTEKQISKIETGVHYPKFENFVKILDSLDITLKDFAEDIDPQQEINSSRKCYMKILNKFSDIEIEYLINVAKELDKLKRKSINKRI